MMTSHLGVNLKHLDSLNQSVIYLCKREPDIVPVYTVGEII